MGCCETPEHTPCFDEKETLEAKVSSLSLKGRNLVLTLDDGHERKVPMMDGWEGAGLTQFTLLPYQLALIGQQVRYEEEERTANCKRRQIEVVKRLTILSGPLNGQVYQHPDEHYLDPKPQKR